MEPLSTFLSTLLGKAVAGAAVAAASVGGLAAADVVELPLPDLDEAPAEVDADLTPVVPETPAAEQAELDATEDEEVAETEEIDEANALDETGTSDDNAEWGQSVATRAQAGELDGQTIAGEARQGTPAEDRAAEPGAPETVGERQDGTARQDAEAPQGDEAADDAPPADAGTQTEARPEAPAAADAPGRVRP